MFEPAFIQQCADPGVEIAIVERFISEIGTDNPLAVRITSGNRVILPEAPKTPDDAMRLIGHYLGRAVVRVGVTQYPAGHAISEPSQLTKDMVDACGNIRMGTALFGKVYRIVAHARGGSDAEVFGEALDAWKTGMFEGRYVFGVADPGPLPASGDVPLEQIDRQELGQKAAEHGLSADAEPISGARTLDPNDAGIRVNLPASLNNPDSKSKSDN